MSDENLPVNLGNPHELSIIEFADLINELTGNNEGKIFLEGKRVEGDPQTRQPDIRKAKRLLDWKPTIDIREGLEQTIASFQNQMERRG